MENRTHHECGACDTVYSIPIIAWAWKTKREGRDWMTGWALGHIKPTRENLHLKEGEELEVHALVFSDSEDH